MSSLVIFFAVVIAVIVTNNEAEAYSVPEINVDINLGKILDLLKQQQNRNSRFDNSGSSSSSESDLSDDDSRSPVPRTDSGEFLYALLKEAFKYDPNVIADDRDRNNHKDRSSNVKRAQLMDNKSAYEYIVNQILNGYPNSQFPAGVAPKSYYHSRAALPKKRLTPNRLMWNDNNKKSDSLEDYSKVYIMLTPKAVQQTKSRSSINDLLSKILSLSSNANYASHRGPQRQKRYKGFAIRNQAGRRRGSREMYAPNDSAEDKPSKRGRSSGGGGHTAIPYIRHRGENIYEKDN